MNHEQHMQRALSLAREGLGLTRPNPPVGATVCRGATVLGTGTHRRAGGPHAEVAALQQAGRRARGSTLYVTLEPCSTQGRTGACTDLILAAGIRRVVVAATDPNPNHAGRGLRLLRRHGVDVVCGVCRADGEALIAPFHRWITTRRPYLTLKLGLSLDGFLADASRRSQWITGPASRREVQSMRRCVDAIMVGIETVCADNPSLTPRPRKGRDPLRVVVDSRGRIPLSSTMLNDSRVVSTVVATTNACPERRAAAIRKKGAHVIRCRASKGGVSMPSLLSALGRLDVLHVLCEGGGELAGTLIHRGLVDEYALFVAPLLLGGGVSVAGRQAWALGVAPKLLITETVRVGDDLLLRAVPKRT
jgi:diaminohydroxyphosphoribosylaminopyrimidine deaminase/5-amino-6-(5-phosphoribosylamino)uracil reductase